jgi:hypothetical protein
MTPPDHLELEELRIPPGERVELVPDPAGLVPGAVDGEAAGLLERGALYLGAAVLVLLQTKLDAFAGEALALPR